MSKAPKKIYVKEFDEGISQTWSSTKAQKTTAIIQHEYIRKDAATEALSLPANLDEAAEKYSENILANNEDLQDAIEDAFKEGAEWMAKQGVTVGGTFHHSSGYPSVIELKTYLREYEGADVIVQVRKK